MELSLVQLLVYILIALVSAYIASALFGTAYPLGFLGAFLAALIGQWLMINVFHIILAPEISYAGIPIITAIVGALVVAILLAAVSRGPRRRRWV
ncbi:MAG: GlsB/YeaQ/YmgE family stress response membrane protein [Chloroflexi bacterium]|nr:GlsB/YeaQ/YmgE family stress response membrane protein [Chloroflexota bacterium]